MPGNGGPNGPINVGGGGPQGRQTPPIMIHDEFNLWQDSSKNINMDKYVDIGVILSIISIIFVISIILYCIAKNGGRKRKGNSEEKVIVVVKDEDEEMMKDNVEKKPFIDK